MVERGEERHAVHEVRGDDARQRPALVVRLADEADVAEPQVAKAAVDQLRRSARRPAAEVAAVDECDSEAVGGSRRCDCRLRNSRSPAAAAEHVEAPLVELGQRPLPGRI